MSEMNNRRPFFALACDDASLLQISCPVAQLTLTILSLLFIILLAIFLYFTCSNITSAFMCFTSPNVSTHPYETLDARKLALKHTMIRFFLHIPCCYLPKFAYFRNWLSCYCTFCCSPLASISKAQLASEETKFDALLSGTFNSVNDDDQYFGLERNQVMEDADDSDTFSVDDFRRIYEPSNFEAFRRMQRFQRDKSKYFPGVRQVLNKYHLNISSSATRNKPVKKVPEERDLQLYIPPVPLDIREEAIDLDIEKKAVFVEDTSVERKSDYCCFSKLYDVERMRRFELFMLENSPNSYLSVLYPYDNVSDDDSSLMMSKKSVSYFSLKIICSVFGWFVFPMTILIFLIGGLSYIYGFDVFSQQVSVLSASFIGFASCLLCYLLYFTSIFGSSLRSDLPNNADAISLLVDSIYVCLNCMIRKDNMSDISRNGHISEHHVHDDVEKAAVHVQQLGISSEVAESILPKAIIKDSSSPIKPESAMEAEFETEIESMPVVADESELDPDATLEKATVPIASAVHGKKLVIDSPQQARAPPVVNIRNLSQAKLNMKSQASVKNISIESLGAQFLDRSPRPPVVTSALSRSSRRALRNSPAFRTPLAPFIMPQLSNDTIMNKSESSDKNNNPAIDSSISRTTMGNQNNRNMSIRRISGLLTLNGSNTNLTLKDQVSLRKALSQSKIEQFFTTKAADSNSRLESIKSRVSKLPKAPSEDFYYDEEDADEENDRGTFRKYRESEYIDLTDRVFVVEAMPVNEDQFIPDNDMDFVLDEDLDVIMQLENQNKYPPRESDPFGDDEEVSAYEWFSLPGEHMPLNEEKSEEELSIANSDTADAYLHSRHISISELQHFPSNLFSELGSPDRTNHNPNDSDTHRSNRDKDDDESHGSGLDI